MKNKYQQALDNYSENVDYRDYSTKTVDIVNESYDILEELVNKETPKKLKSKTDKDGRLLLVCPNCGDVYMKFWSDVETITCRKYCDECGQKLDWSEEND